MKTHEIPKDFDAYCALEDKVLELMGPGFTDGYFPTVEELQKYGAERNVAKFLPLLQYFAADPLEGENSREYRETVRYANDILAGYTEGLE